MESVLQDWQIFEWMGFGWKTYGNPPNVMISVISVGKSMVLSGTSMVFLSMIHDVFTFSNLLRYTTDMSNHRWGKFPHLERARKPWHAMAVRKHENTIQKSVISIVLVSISISIPGDINSPRD